MDILVLKRYALLTFRYYGETEVSFHISVALYVKMFVSITYVLWASERIHLYTF